MGEFRLVVDTVDFAAVLGQGGKGDYVVEIDLKGRVDVVDKCVDVLLGRWTSSASTHKSLT